MNAAIRYQLEAEARRCGFYGEDIERVFALHELKCWAQSRGYSIGSYSSIHEANRTRPGGRQLIFDAQHYRYRIRLTSEPLKLFLDAAAPESWSFFSVGFWVEGLAAQSWEVLKRKLIAREAGNPEPLAPG